MIDLKTIPNWVWLGGAAVVVLYIIKKGGIQNAVQGATAAVVGSAGSVVSGAASGVVLGVGDAVGVKRTDLEICKECIKNGDDFKASQYCTASQFANWQYLSARQRLTGKTFTMSDIFK